MVRILDLCVLGIQASDVQNAFITDFGLEPKSVICWERHFNLLKKTGVACVPGEAFYHDDAGERLARFCYAKEDTVLDEACRRIERLTP